MVVWRGLLLTAGLLVVVFTLGAAFRTVVLPRGVPSRLARVVFVAMRYAFRIRLGKAPTYDRRDRVMAAYGPLSLLALLQVWLLLAWLGYAAAFLAVDTSSPWRAIQESGSSLLTLGMYAPRHRPAVLLAFSEATVGLVLLALLITYLPSLYAAFSRREAAVSKLEVRAGTPPSGREMLWRAWVLDRMDILPDVWNAWEDFFVDIEESHTSFPALTFFRSPQPDHSWVTGAGAVLDAAALRASCFDLPRDLGAELVIRSGYIALRRIATFFRIEHDPSPLATDPVSITRDEFNEVYEGFAREGMPVRADRQVAWEAFSGWRVNYDVVLISLATLTMAPYAPWSSDRTIPRSRRGLRRARS